ncbi:MAG: type II/IV secretion system ATPase subunit [archaeon]
MKKRIKNRGRVKFSSAREGELPSFSGKFGSDFIRMNDKNLEREEEELKKRLGRVQRYSGSSAEVSEHFGHKDLPKLPETGKKIPEFPEIEKKIPEFPELKSGSKGDLSGVGEKKFPSFRGVKKNEKVPEPPRKKEIKQDKVHEHKVVFPEKKIKGTLLERYEIEVDGANADVQIRKDGAIEIYHLDIPAVSPATATLLDEIRNELIAVTTISMKELTDPSLFFSIKKKFMADAKRLFNERLPRLDEKIEKFLVGVLMQEMLGLGKIEFLVADPNLEEIVIPSAKEPIRVYSKKYGWLSTNFKIEKEEEIINYANIIARRVGRQITVLNPLLDAHLVTGDRINAVLYPVNTKGNTITIRKFARDPFTMVDFIDNGTCDAMIVALLWLAIEYEMNVLISGGTGSGKTSFLNACMPFIPPNQRIISIEDTRELMLPEFLYWTPLVTRTSNPEGKGEVSMLDLLVNSLRMRPDRIVLGEMRKQQEAMVLFEAMHTGHSVYATVHADSAAETISRLVNPPINVPPNLLKAVNLNVVMFRDRKKGIRRVLQIAEFEAGSDVATSNILYRWVSTEDKIVKHSTSSRFFEDVSRNTGMSQTEVERVLEEKKNVLLWLVKQHIRSLEDFGKVMNLYYTNRDLLINSIKKGDKSIILGG